MKVFIAAFLVTIPFSCPTFAADQNCIKSFASQPFCMNVLSAEANCERGEGEVKNIKTCLEENAKKIPDIASKQELLFRICLVNSVSDSRSEKNKSFCEN